MKFFLAFFALFALVNARRIEPEISELNDAYGYLKKYGVPAADRIRQAEEDYKRGVRIVGGSSASLGQFPYQAGLLVEFPGGTGVCGGSLVSRDKVVTAAHCWNDGQSQAIRLTVVLGSITLFSGGTRIVTSDVVMHNSWNPNLIRNDIGIIRLPSAVSVSNNIRPIALPSGSQINENYAGDTGIASGFGLTSDGGSITTSQFLSHVRLPIITNSVCSRSFPLMIQSSNICTSGANGQSTCRGDSGGPLAVIRNNVPVLVGATSFGSARGCQQGFPAAFARITSFISWINANL